MDNGEVRLTSSWGDEDIPQVRRLASSWTRRVSRVPWWEVLGSNGENRGCNESS